MDEDEIIKQIAAKLEQTEKRDERLREQLKRWNDIAKMPFFKRIQQPEMKETLKQVEKIQEETIERILKKYHKGLEHNYKLFFNEFWNEFLKGQTLSINEYLYGQDKEKQKRKILKPHFSAFFN